MVPLAAQATSVGADGMVASVDEYATEAGIAILKARGNAVDAAIAMHMVLAVTYPQAGNIGGGGFFVIHLADEGIQTTIDFREKAPGAASRNMYLDESGEVIEDTSTLGYRASGVPGAIAGLWLAHQKYGSLPWEQLMEPALELARDGISVNYWLARSLRASNKELRLFESTAKIFTKDGQPYEFGDLFVQKDLAWTIEQIMKKGRDGFYIGEVAGRIAADMNANGGLITEADLAAYDAVERPPIRGVFSGYEFISMPPPSSGGVLLKQMLAMLEPFDLKAMGHNSSKYIQLLTEVEKLAYADRAEFLGDPDFYEVPANYLTSPEYVAVRSKLINLDKTTPATAISHGPAPGRESEETTHFSVVDSRGNAVSCTTTLNGSFGSCVVAKGTGVLLNNQMDDFSIKPGFPNIYGLIGGEANAIAPGKRMLSSMTPTVVLREGRVVLVIGSPGGSTIITTVLQVFLNYLVHGMTLQQSVAAPRFHHQWLPDITLMEKSGFSRDVIEILQQMGHEIRLTSGIGDMHAIAVEQDTHLLIGCSDPRRGGVARGY
jgi:gamma-glutamyltranspeptidase/glutathione hydrolase